MKNKNKINIFYKLFFGAAVFFSAFVLAELGNKFWAVGAAGIVVLIAAYLYLAQREKEKQEEKAEKEQEKKEFYEKLEELTNVEKAVYTAVKRGNDEIEKQIVFMGREGNAKEHETLLRIAAAQEQMISESKRLAEIQVNALKIVAKYNKENARQLALNINGNADKLSERFQNSLTGLKGSIAGVTAQAVSDEEEHYQSVAERTPEALFKTVSAPEPEEAREAVSEIIPEAVSEPIPKAAGEPITVSIPELEPALESSVPAAPEPDDPNRKMSAGDISALIASMGAGNASESAPEPEAAGEPITASIPEPEAEPVSEPEPALESSVPAAPEPDDPNRKMNADDIAALIASMGVGSEPEPAPEPEVVSESMSIPIPEPEPISETVPEPAAPVMDDPNRKMSADDIAALIASMGK